MIRVLFVCLGNICRSPMAEGIFNRFAAENGINVVAESFGLSAITGAPVSENSIKVCNEIEVDISNLKSTSVNDIPLEKYEKFYCMSQSHSRILSECCFVPIKDIEVLNICDPYGGNEFIYRECRDEIYNSVKEIIKNYEN